MKYVLNALFFMTFVVSSAAFAAEGTLTKGTKSYQHAKTTKTQVQTMQGQTMAKAQASNPQDVEPAAGVEEQQKTVKSKAFNRKMNSPLSWK